MALSLCAVLMGDAPSLCRCCFAPVVAGDGPGIQNGRNGEAHPVRWCH